MNSKIFSNKTILNFNSIPEKRIENVEDIEVVEDIDIKKYGQVFEEVYEDDYTLINSLVKVDTRDLFRKAMTDYFDNIYMQKIKIQDDNSIYMCKLPCNLINENRYIIAYVEQDNNKLGHCCKLGDLKWNCIQTRQIQDKHEVTLFNQTYKYKENISPYNTKIYLIDQNDLRSTYECKEFPDVQIVLLSKKSDSFMYPRVGTISSAIETFKTIIIFK